MIATLDNYHEPIRQIADEMIAARRRSYKPLARAKAFLEGLEECGEALIKVLVKLESIIVLTILICFFAWGALDHLIKLHGQPPQPAPAVIQSHSGTVSNSAINQMNR